MSRLEDAVNRLERAVARLEKAATRIGESDAQRHAALSKSTADYAALRDATESVAARLDAAIHRLDRMLEG
jgi:ubiquinone biosynthesis protein UbiJ